MRGWIRGRLWLWAVAFAERRFRDVSLEQRRHLESAILCCPKCGGKVLADVLVYGRCDEAQP